MNYSCVRVGTVKQDEKRKDIALNNYKINKKYIDKATCKNADRPQLNKLIIEANNGDNIFI